MDEAHEETTRRAQELARDIYSLLVPEKRIARVSLEEMIATHMLIARAEGARDALMGAAADAEDPNGWLQGTGDRAFNADRVAWWLRMAIGRWWR